MTDEELVLSSALRVMTDQFNAFIGACMDASGKPKAPTYRDLMAARGYLPRRCKHALEGKPKDTTDTKEKANG